MSDRELAGRIASGAVGPGIIAQLAAVMAKVHVFQPEAYCAHCVGAERYLIIVPARNEWEAATGSGILAIATSRLDAWNRALARLNEPKQE